MKFRTTLSALAIASLAAFAAQAQTTMPAEQPAATPAAPMEPVEGQRSTPQQDRGAMAGMVSEEEARNQAQEAKYALEAARFDKDGGPSGEMSVPHQDRGGFYGLGDPNGAMRYQHDRLAK